MKKYLLMAVSFVLVAALAVVGTLAYLQFETPTDVNVMTVGNVKIAQHEYERAVNADGSYKTETIDNVTSYVLQDFTQAKPILPVTEIDANGNPVNHGAGTWDATTVRMTQVDSYGGMQVFVSENAQDKFVTVENTGKTDAYVRTIVALEIGSADSSLIGTSYHMNWTRNIIGVVTIDNNNYELLEYIYKGADGVRHDNGILPAGETTYPNLSQVYLSSEATNEDMEALDGNGNGTFDILVISQAVQAKGFDDAATALDAAFGDITVNNHPWVSGAEEYFPVVVEVADSAELAAAIAENQNVIVNLKDGAYTTNLKLDGGKDVTINGSKNAVLSGQIATTSSTAGTLTLNGVTVKVDDSIADSTGISQTGKSAIAIWGNQTVVCNGVTFDMSLNNSTAITSWWDTNEGTSIVVKNCVFNCNGQRPIRATGNVTVEGCTFNDPYRYAVQLTAKADTATKLDKAIINFNNNTIVNGENGKAFVYGIQLEGADYGCNDCVINGEGNVIENGGADSAMYYCECGKVVHETIEWNVEVTPVHEQ